MSTEVPIEAVAINESRRLHIPAIGLMVTSGISIAFQLLFLAVSLVAEKRDLSQIADDDTRRGAEVAAALNSPLPSLLALAVTSVAFIGGLMMVQGRSYEIARAGAVAGMLPCASLCILNFPFALWAFIVLSSPNVRRSFIN